MAITPNKKGARCSIPVVCINDKGRPSDIPLSKWPVKDRKYTITSVVIMNSMGGRIGVTLEEISLDGCYPYKFYLGERFGIPSEDGDLLARAEELLKEAQEEFSEIAIEESLTVTTWVPTRK